VQSMPSEKHKVEAIQEKKLSTVEENKNVVQKNMTTPPTPIEERLDLLKKWLNGITTAHVAYSKLTAEYKQRSRMLGLIVTIISTIIGTSIFASLNVSNNQIILAVVGTVSLLASILSGVNTFLNYGELASTYSDASSKWGELRRHVEEVSVTINDLHALDAAIQDIETKWNTLTKTTPPIPEKTYTKVKEEISKPKPKEQWE
jgi:hypothetical protein